MRRTLGLKFLGVSTGAKGNNFVGCGNRIYFQKDNSGECRCHCADAIALGE